MKGELPSPEFRSSRYDRPIEDWVCGWAADGDCCRMGPDAAGRCRATHECQPALERKPGEEKGRYRCTRPKEYGGTCELGPWPDGNCRCPVPRCQPARSMRGRRKAFTRQVVMATAVLLVLLLGGSRRMEFVNPGALSAQHSGVAFVGTNGVGVGEHGCGNCHSAGFGLFEEWVEAAGGAVPGPFNAKALAGLTDFRVTSIDVNCRSCHERRADRQRDYRFHQPNVVRDRSCAACHQEHQGGGNLKETEDRGCVSCHGDGEVMEASYRKGLTLAAGDFDYRSDQTMRLFRAPRPERGYTKRVTGFATDHPEFQVHAAGLRDRNPLRFDHQLHLTGEIPELHGRNLACADCHLPDAAGHYHLQMSFEGQCRACHSIQFDAETPELTLPHGKVEEVKAFLRNLPWAYEVYARNIKGLTGKREVDGFVVGKLRSLQDRVGSVERLEEWVFSGRVEDRKGSAERTLFPGCALCHETERGADGLVSVRPPTIPGRWLIRSEFNHSKHAVMACDQCHSVVKSKETSDILLPMRETCVSCHSPEGGTAHNCVTCHRYHVPVRGEASE